MRFVASNSGFCVHPLVGATVGVGALRRLLVCILLGLGMQSPAAPAAGTGTNKATAPGVERPYVRWHRQEGTFDAQVENWSLQRTLREITAATSWEIAVEPDLQRTVTARFRALPTAEALRGLLGDLNFALLPRSPKRPALYIFRNNIQDATETVTADPGRARSPGALPNDLLVTLKPGQKIDELAKRLGAKVTGRIDDLNAYRLEFDSAADAADAREALLGDENVAAVDDNHALRPPGQLEPLSAASVPALNLRARNVSDDKRVVIGLIDTAVQSSGTGLKDFLLEGIQAVGPSQPPKDTPTHGTSMAETMLRALALASPSAEGTPVRILPVDVYGGNSTTTTFDVARGIHLAALQGADIVNLSLGSEGGSPFLERMIQEARKAGILLVGAAGNEPVTTPMFPAAYAEVLATTAADRAGRIASFANRGDFVDLLAPGASIVHLDQQAYLGMGTSFSAAFVSGTAAAIATTTPGVADIEAELRKRFARPPAGGR